MARISPVQILLALGLAGCTSNPPPPRAVEVLPTVASPPVQVELPPEPPPVPKASPAVAPGQTAVPVATARQLIWSTDSTTAEGTLSQRPGPAPGSCVLAFFSRRINQEVWNSSHCIALADDLRFVAADGRSVLVLHPAVDPEKWETARLVEITRAGEPLAALTGAELLEPSMIRGKTAVVWVRGLTAPGEPPPALNPSGAAVVFARLDNTRMSVDFEGKLSRLAFNPATFAASKPPDALPPEDGGIAAPAPAPPAAPAPGGKPPPTRPTVMDAYNCNTYGNCKGTGPAEKNLNQSDFNVPSKQSSVVTDGHSEDQVHLDR